MVLDSLPTTQYPMGDIEKIGGGKSGVEATGVVYQGESYVSDVQVSSQAAAQAMACNAFNVLASVSSA